MSEPIGPGDWVECIDARPRSQLYTDGVYRAEPTQLVEGALYFVECLAVENNGGVGVVLKGLRSLARHGSYAPDRFRPIRDGQERIVKPEKVYA